MQHPEGASRNQVGGPHTHPAIHRPENSQGVTLGNRARRLSDAPAPKPQRTSSRRSFGFWFLVLAFGDSIESVLTRLPLSLDAKVH
jgi:hypothetical protein